MTTNYDPKPGRWMLPLVVLAMVAFTYLFVRELPASAGGDSDESTTTTAFGATTTSDGDTTSTTFPLELDQATQVYLETVAAYQTRMADLQTQLASANSGWDADPRTVTFDQAEAAFIQVAEGASALATESAALVPPDALGEQHAAVATSAQQAADAANAALAGLRAPSPDTGEARRDAVAAFDTAVAAFGQAIADANPAG